jgi:hypothetical protein
LRGSASCGCGWKIPARWRRIPAVPSRLDETALTYRPYLTLAVVGSVVAIAVLGVVALRGERTRMPTAPSMVAAGAPLPSGRTVRLTHTMPHPSRGAVLDAKLVRGAMPRGRTSAVVLSDTDCAPDAHGISHCLDRLRLVSGRVISVRHVHDMKAVRCLTPGEHVRVVPARSVAA